MADALLDWVYHSNQTLPGTAVASLVTTNRQLVQVVGGFGLAASFWARSFLFEIQLRIVNDSDFKKLSCEH